jgi:hypothetical protein
MIAFGHLHGLVTSKRLPACLEQDVTKDVRPPLSKSSMPSPVSPVQKLEGYQAARINIRRTESGMIH